MTRSRPRGGIVQAWRADRRRHAELADMQAFPGQPSPTANAEDSTTSGSGHRHPA